MLKNIVIKTKYKERAILAGLERNRSGDIIANAKFHIMKIHCLTFEVSPAPYSNHFEESGGAIINCWIKSNSKDEAELTAKEYIQSEGWDIISLTDYDLPEREWYIDAPDSLEQFDNALKYREAYITHTWPPEPQESEIIH